MARILLVEDNELNRDMLTRRLERLGYEVVPSAGGREAIALLDTQTFDLALLDIMMPEVSGLDVLEAIRRRYSLADLPVIMVTAKSTSEDLVEALRLGANDFVAKPIDFAVLTARIRTHLELERLSQLKDEFMRIASHDIKNPLTEVMSIASLVDLTVKPGEPVPERVYALLQNLKKSAKKIQFMIEDFLEFQALEAGELKLSLARLDLTMLAREACEGNHAYAEEKGIALALDVGAEPLAVMADERRLAQVVHNLVNNALKFTPRGGHITIGARRDGEHGRFFVTDSGPGLSAEDEARLFQKYARLSTRPTGGEKGSGLGLVISKELITAHHGQIGAHNGEGGGATFWFSLPLAEV